MSDEITALFDGDWILYAAGFAGQKNEIVYPDAFPRKTFKTMTQLKAALADKGMILPDDAAVYSRFVLDPDSHFYHSAKMMIEKNCDKIALKFGVEDVQIAMLIDGDGNFRSQLATIRPYKGQRSVHAKPLKYNDIRQYLIEAWEAEVIHNQETDDEMAIRQANGDHTVIVSVDKDMLQVPGWHLNPNKGFKKISEIEGLTRLYRQAAQGDAVDNIGGAYKVGPAAAKTAFPLDLNESQMWHKLVALYQESIEKHGNRYGGLTAAQAALENMRLVYLRRTPGELWLPPESR